MVPRKSNKWRHIYSDTLNEQWVSAVFELRPTPLLPLPNSLMWKLHNRPMKPSPPPIHQGSVGGHLPRRGRCQHFPSCPQYLLLMLKFWQVLLRGGIAPLRPTLILKCGPTPAAVPLSILRPQCQPSKTWSYCSPFPLPLPHTHQELRI